MEVVCDNTSVGVIIQNEKEEVLLLNRAKFPFGLAAPAGHTDEHGGPELTAIAEVREEVGLIIAVTSLKKVIEDQKVDRACRRKGGDYHIWTVFRTTITDQETTASEEETLGLGWYSSSDLQKLADYTKNNSTKNTEAGAQILEPVWLDFFVQLGFVDK